MNVIAAACGLMAIQELFEFTIKGQCIKAFNEVF